MVMAAGGGGLATTGAVGAADWGARACSYTEIELTYIIYHDCNSKSQIKVNNTGWKSWRWWRRAGDHGGCWGCWLGWLGGEGFKNVIY
jgi:hypothetical protein